MNTTTEFKIDAEPTFGLLRIRKDVYGNEFGKVDKELDSLVFAKHVSGTERIGFYCINPKNNTIKWICVDFDVEFHPIEKAVEFVRICRNKFNLTAHLEKSKSGGGHVWFFIDGEVPAWKARRVFQFILSKMGLRTSNANNSDSVELFPKQDSIEEDGYGNYVYSPFSGRDMPEGRTLFIDYENGLTPYPDQMHYLRNIKKVTEKDLDRIIKENNLSTNSSTLERKSTPFNNGQNNNNLQQSILTKRNNLLPCARKVSDEGVDEGQRDCVIFAMAKHYKRAGYTKEEAEAELLVLNQKNRPPMNEHEIRTKVEQAEKRNGLDCENTMQPWCDKDNCPLHTKHIHLIDIEKSENAGRTISTDIMVAGIGETYIVPKRYTVSCSGKDCEHASSCKYLNNTHEINIPSTNDELIAFTKQTDYQRFAAMKNFAGLEKGCSVNINIQEHISVQVYIAVPKVDLVQYDPKTQIIKDEKGRDYREKIIYHAGTIDQTNTYYRAIGKVLPNPKNSEATLLVEKMIKISSSFEEFVLTSQIKEQLEVFVPKEKTKEGILNKFNEIAKDISIHTTKVTGEWKEHILKGNLLVYASPLHVYFNDIFLQNGIANILIIGDTAQGKSTIAKRLQEAIGYGAYVHGSSSNRTGLLYSLDTKIENFRTLRWGVMATENKRLIIVDEAQKLGFEAWEEMSLARSEGIIKVDKSIKGEHPMLTRQIYIANPRDIVTGRDKAISEHMYGIEACKLMRAPDIRRFDFVMVVAIGDDDSSEINKLYREQMHPNPIFTAPLLRTWIDWVWSKPYQMKGTIIWKDNSDKTVMEAANDLFKDHSCVDIPLLVEDTKDKIARLSVSMANIAPFVIDNVVHVYPAHVEIIKDFLADNYKHKSNLLNEYAKIKKEQSCLTNEEYEMAKSNLETQLSNDLPDFVKIFRENEYISAGELGAFFSWTDKSTVSDKITPLKKHGFVTSSKGGYRKRPKFIEFIRKYSNEPNLTNNK